MEIPDQAELEKQRQEQTEAAYRAIGRYIVEFSELVWAMRGMIETHLNGPLAGADTEDEPRVGASVELLLGEATAQYIANVFFATCREVGELDESELDVTNALSDAVNKVIEERNHIAHGDWIVWFPGTPPWVTRTRPARKTGPRKSEDYPPEDLERKTDNMEALTDLVVTYGDLALGLWMLIKSEDGTIHERRPDELRVRDVLIKPKKAPVEATGPKAHLVILGDP